MSMPRCLCLLFFMLGLSSEGFSETRTFTNKEGREIEAEIVSVSADWTKVSVQANNQIFALPPNSLSLDDQQFIKDWLKRKGSLKPNLENGAGVIMVTADANVDDVTISIRAASKLESSERPKREEYYRYVSRKFGYEIEIMSLGKIPIEEVIVEYAIVWDEAYTPSGSNYVQRGERAIKGVRTIKQMEYNRKRTVKPRLLTIDARISDYSSYEDKVLGLIVQVKSPNGRILKTFRDGDGEREDLKWSEVNELTSGASYDIPSSGPISLTLEKGDLVESRIPVKGRKIEILATGVRPKANSGGVIAELGGGVAGVSLFVRGKEMVWAVRQRGNLREVTTEIPLGEFDVKATLSQRNGMVLTVDNGRPVFREDVKQLNFPTKEGLSIGSPGGEHVSKNYGGDGDGDFDGDIGSVTFNVD